MDFAFTKIFSCSMYWKDQILPMMDRGIGIERVATIYVPKIPASALNLQYFHKIKEPYEKETIDTIARKPLLFSIYLGEKDLYKSLLANKEKVREKFNPRIQQPNQKRYPGLQHVAIHCSASREEAQREYKAWKNYLFHEEGRDIKRMLDFHGVKSLDKNKQEHN